MDAAIWAVIGDTVPAAAGLLLVLYLYTAIHVGLLDGLRVDRFKAFGQISGSLARLAGKSKS
jgi:hypothetical protein